jgi:ATP-dependent helicase/nuclease subunit B
MSATLYLAPTTDAVLNHIAEYVAARRRYEQKLAPLTFLLPSGDAVRQLRRELGNAIAVRPLQFYSLSAAILTEAGDDTREMNDLATRRLVRGVLAQLHERGALTTFAPMLDKPGFVDVLVEWLREMKTQGITPEQVAAHAGDNKRDGQLSRIYARYQQALREGGCADADGLLWRAAEALEGDARLLLSAGELLIAGFDQFSPVQLRMVTALAQRMPVSVYLLWDTARAETSLALSRLAPTRRALVDALRPVEVALPAADRCGPTLGHLRRSLFESAAQSFPDASGCVTAIAAPNGEAEVRRALREIKRLLLDGSEAERIALLAPHPKNYRAMVSAISREYGVPVAVETTLGENPCVAALLNVLALAPRFPWRQTFDALRSPYVRQEWLDAEQIARLDALTRERPVIAGWDQWEYALTPPQPEGDEDAADDEDRGEPPLLSQLPPESVIGMRDGLRAFFRHITPPRGASPAQFVAWIQNALLGLTPDAGDDETSGEPPAVSLRMADAAEEGEWRRRDLRALNALMRALRQWLDAQALVEELRLDPDREVAQELRWRELLEWLPTVPAPPDPRHTAVRFGPLEKSRAVTVDHLFVLGLGEGEFPRPPQPDPFYTAAERAAHPLRLVRTDSGEDASLWWQVLCNCQCSLTLLRSRIDANGAEWLPSAYWEAVVGLIAGLPVEQPRIAAAPLVGDAACVGEVLEALSCGGAVSAPPEISSAWGAVKVARAVAAARDGWGAPGEHEGILADATITGDARSRYGPRRSWSVSRLNRFGACPYAFWSQYALKLEAIDDPAEGMNAQQRGTLIHKMLEVLFARLDAAGIAPGETTVDQVLDALARVCDDILPRAAERYGFRPGPLWDREQGELRNELAAYMTWECTAAHAGSFRPFLQELKFGLPGSRYGAVEIAGVDGETVSLHGVIDRIDRDETGRLRVIDYKTGSTPISERDIEDGRALQSALYAWTAGLLLRDEGDVVLSAYRHTGSRKQSGPIRCESDEGAAMVARAAARAVGFAVAARAGWFAPLPSRGSGGKACAEKCDFIGVCRVTRHAIRKAQRHGPPLTGVGGTDGGEA